MSFRRIFGVKAPVSSPQAIAMGGLGLSGRAVRQLNRLQLNTRNFLPGSAAGARSSHQRRPAMDFREHRMYTPGDDVRFVDWKASARQEHVFIKQGEYLKDATVTIVLDGSASMAWGSPPKSGAALALAAALGYLALAQGDRLMVIPLNGQHQQGKTSFPPLGPVSGKSQFAGVLKYLRSLPFQGQVDLAKSLAGFNRRNTRGGGLVLVISDLLGMQDLARALRSLPIPTWNIVLFHLLHPAELNPQLRGDFELQDIETGRRKLYTVTEQAVETYRRHFKAWQNRMEEACLKENAIYTMIASDWTLEGEIIPHLRGINVVKAL